MEKSDAYKIIAAVVVAVVIIAAGFLLLGNGSGQDPGDGPEAGTDEPDTGTDEPGTGTEPLTFSVGQSSFTETGDGEVSLSSYTQPPFDPADPWGGAVMVPSTVQHEGVTYTVTSVGPEAFAHAAEVDTVFLPDTIRSIGSEAFAETALRQINMPAGLESIGEGAFMSTSIGSGEFTIPGTVKDIGPGAFAGCWNITGFALGEGSPFIVEDGVLYTDDGVLLQYPAGRSGGFQVPNGTVAVAASAFYSSNVRSVILPASVEQIGQLAFALSTLTDIDTGSVASIGDNAFYGCTQLESVDVRDGLVSLGECAFGECLSLAHVGLPGSLESIGAGAFIGCLELSDVDLGEGLLTIGESAFSGCVSLTSVTIPASVEQIGQAAFSGCESIAGYDVAPGGSFVSSDGVLFSADMTRLLSYPDMRVGGSYEIPSTVTSIDALAFDDCSRLTSISVPSTVTELGEYAFSSCTSLRSIDLSGVDELPMAVLNQCSSLSEVVLSDTLRTVGDWALAGTAIAEVSLPSTVESIGSYAFMYCGSLRSVSMGDVASVGEFAFYGCTSVESVATGVLSDVGELAFSLGVSGADVECSASCPEPGMLDPWAGEFTEFVYS